MNLEIEHNIPLPTRTRKSLYPFDQLNPGDSFLVPNTTKTKNIQQAAWQYARSRNLIHKFVARQVDNGVRVWRTQ